MKFRVLLAVLWAAFVLAAVGAFLNWVTGWPSEPILP